MAIKKIFTTESLVAGVICLLVVPAILSLVFFNFYSMFDVPNPSSKMGLPIMVIPIAIFLSCLMALITKFFLSFSYKKTALAVASALIVAFQFTLMFSTNPMPSFDAASLIAVPFNSETVDYAFYANSNNGLLGAFFIFIHSIVSAVSGSSETLVSFMYTVISLSILCVDFSIGGLLYLAKRFLRNKGLIIAYILAACTALTFPSILIPYSDTFAMPFVMAILLIGLRIFDCFMKKPIQKNRLILWGLLFCALNIIGYLIKPTVIFMTLALLMVAVISFTRKKSLLKNLLAIGKPRLAIIGFLVIASILCVQKLQLESVKFIYATKGVAMPEQYITDRSATFLHFLSTGSNPNFGYFDSASADNLYSSQSQAEINTGALEILSQRLNEYGAPWYVGLLAEKNLMNLSDGVFFYGEFGGNKDASIPFAPTDQNSVFYEYVWSSGKVWAAYKYFANAVWLIVLIGLVCSATYNVRRRNALFLSCHIALICLLVFLAIFEARSRYLILYLPIFIFVAANGLSHIQSKLPKKLR